MKRQLLGGTLLGLALCLSVSYASTYAQTPRSTVTYPAGLNLVAGPPGSDFSAAQGDLSTLQSGYRDYQTAPPAQGTSTGFGYWAQFAAPATVQLDPGSNTAYTTHAVSGQWILIGDPSGTLPALVTGADAVYTYDPSSGYSASTTLQPGQGAWALPGSGGLIAVTPETPDALAAAANLHTFNGTGYQVGVPADWDRVSTSGSQHMDAEFTSADGNAALSAYNPQALPSGTRLNAVRILTAYLSDPDVVKDLHLGQPIAAPQAVSVANADAAATATVPVADDSGDAFVATFLLAIHNNNLYVLVIATTPAYAAQNADQITQIVNSFQLAP